MEQGRMETAPTPLRVSVPAQATPSARGEHPCAEPAYGHPATVSVPAARKLPQRHSVRGQILDALRSALVGGELVPGEVYSGPALGERFGVSATPVREAMQQLVLEGAVEVVPNRGFRVARRSARDLAELAEIRVLLEVPAMLRLARTGRSVDWSAIRPLAEATSAAAARGDRAAYAESDRAFHRALLALTGNRQLVLIADDLHRRSQWPAPHTPSARPTDLLTDASEHLALLEALAAQDAATVEELVTGHFTGAV
ncbi:GntR family transcriptional regulator [Streptomyces sp. NPDC057654]|uniref:GntR family transcriptional regulator n=1 Tax=Streptomyces sp. NPDC057654 TaxID=3346196 RepID=UPI0036A3E939